MRTLSKLSVGFLVLGMGGVASANAFLLGEHDAKPVGRGNASTATATDPSSIVYNIGGLAVEEGTHVMIGGALILPGSSFTDDATGSKTDIEKSYPVIPQLYFSTRVNDSVALGIGFHAPFGLELTWPDSARTLDVVKFISLRTYFITPSVGVNLSKYVPGLTVGAGLDLVPSTVELRRKIYFADTEGEAHLGGDAFGIGGRIGVMYKPASLPQLSFGAMWRSQVNEDYSGKADFDIADAYRSQLPPDGDISTKVEIPQSVVVGAAYRPTSELELEVGLTYVNWSKFKELRIKLPDMTDSVAPEDYEDKITLRVGAEYKLPKYKAAVRAGYIYDPTPIPATTVSPQLPDADRHDLTVGGSYSFSNYDVHFGVLWVMPQSRKTSDELYMPLHKGTYDINALVASLTFAGHFGK